MNRFGDAYFIIYAHHRQRRGERCVLAPTGAGPVDESAYRRAPRNAAGLPGGVPPPERARQRVGLKVDRLLRLTIHLLL